MLEMTAKKVTGRRESGAQSFHSMLCNLWTPSSLSGSLLFKLSESLLKLSDASILLIFRRLAPLPQMLSIRRGHLLNQGHEYDG